MVVMESCLSVLSRFMKSAKNARFDKADLSVEGKSTTAVFEQ